MESKKDKKSILISGCSSGIGFSAAKALSLRGWEVFAGCRKEKDIEFLQTNGLTPVRLDYNDQASLKDALSMILEKTNGRLDALFNNGAYSIPGALEDMPTDAMRDIFETNVFGWHSLTRSVIPVMRQQGHGRIIQCSSILGILALSYRGPYNATKWAVEGLSDTLRLELEGSGIYVISIRPGPISTKFRENSIPHFEKWIDRNSSYLKNVYEERLVPRLYDPDKASIFQLEAEAVTKKVIQALEARRPSMVYSVTLPTHFMGFLIRILPKFFLHRLLLLMS
ncbi:MAG: short-chain dehydrogenase [Magnetovibrio sp.]|nr:short-chain dehydrogenase [Magnetovibrio sp.]